MQKIKVFLLTVLLLLFFVVALALGIMNTQEVNFNYIIAQATFKLCTLLAIAFIFGFLLSFLMSSFLYFKYKFKIYNLTAKLNNAQSELISTKNELVETKNQMLQK